MNKKLARIGLGLAGLYVLILAADIAYDSQTIPEKALKKCGADGVKSVSTKGLFKIDIQCAAPSQ